MNAMNTREDTVRYYVTHSSCCADFRTMPFCSAKSYLHMLYRSARIILQLLVKVRTAP